MLQSLIKSESNFFQLEREPGWVDPLQPAAKVWLHFLCYWDVIESAANGEDRTVWGKVMQLSSRGKFPLVFLDFFCCYYLALKWSFQQFYLLLWPLRGRKSETVNCLCYQKFNQKQCEGATFAGFRKSLHNANCFAVFAVAFLWFLNSAPLCGGQELENSPTMSANCTFEQQKCRIQLHKGTKSQL